MSSVPLTRGAAVDTPPDRAPVLVKDEVVGCPSDHISGVSLHAADEGSESASGATSADFPKRNCAKRNPHKDASYVYERVSKATGLTTWWGDFRRFRDVGGRQERLSPYLRPDEGEIRDGEHARTLYWRGVDLYQQKRQNSAKSSGATDEPAPTEAGANRSALRLVQQFEEGSSGSEPMGQQVAAAVWRAGQPSEVPALLTELITAVREIRTEVQLGGQNNVRGADLLLGPAAADHLKWKREQVSLGNGSLGTCETDETSFKALCDTLGEDCRLGDITVQRLEKYIKDRLSQSGWKKDTTISTATVRNELHALSNLFTKFAKRELIALPNPVSKVTKPAPPDGEAEYLQLTECARLLDAAVLIDRETAKAIEAMVIVRKLRSVAARGRRRPAEEQGLFDLAETLYPSVERGRGWHRRFRYVEALLATFLYTGARSEEVRGLTVEEINWDRSEINLRFNEWRGLKCVHCTRQVPMLSEHRRILKRYLAQSGITRGLLFLGASEAMLGSLQTILPRALALAEIRRAITPHSLRHTYATAILNTWLEGPNGQLVQRSSHMVAKLLGQIDSKLVDNTYGHLRWDAGMMRELACDSLRRYPSTRT